MGPVTALAGVCLQDVEGAHEGGVRGCWPRASDRSRVKQRIHPLSSRFTPTSQVMGPVSLVVIVVFRAVVGGTALVGLPCVAASSRRA